MPKVVKSDSPTAERSERSHARHTEIDTVRDTVAKFVRVVFMAFGVILALAAFLVAAQDNVSQDNVLVKFILNFAEAIDGPFSRENGIFDFHGANGDTKDAVVNWGLAALVYLVVGRYLQRLVGPQSSGSER